MSYWTHKGPLAGDAWKIPFVGPFLESVNPQFSKYHQKWLSGALSCVSVFHKFVVIAATRDMARKVLNSPAYVKPCVVDVAHKLLRPENWVFLDGKEHVEYRKGLNGLFTRNALETYLPGQEEVYNEYLEEFLRESEAAGEPKAWVYYLRELMCAVSCRTFVGHYMSREGVKRIADDYYNITAALELVNFPIILPFTKTWYGKKAADKVLEAFANCAAKARVRMRQKGAQPECIMDRWLMQMIESDIYRERIAKGEKVPQEEKPAMLLRNFSDIEISMTVFTFLFASQDATSSAASWMLQICADRPDVLEKVREEGQRLRPDVNQPVSLETLEKMVSMIQSMSLIQLLTLFSGIHPCSRQRDPPLPPTRAHGPLPRQEGLPHPRSKLRREERHHDHPLNMALPPRPRSIRQPRRIRTRSMDHW